METNEMMMPYQNQMEISGLLCSWASCLLDAAQEASKPHVIMKPKLSLDGNMWCALYGENIQDGVAGFGTSPAKAMEDFDKAWTSDNWKKGKK